MLGGPVYAIDGIRFEWSDHFGPAVVGKNGEILDRQPGPRSRFWLAVTWWAQQGKRFTDDGQCLYDQPAAPRLVQLAGRNYVEVPDGEEPEETRRRWLTRLGFAAP